MYRDKTSTQRRRAAADSLRRRIRAQLSLRGLEANAAGESGGAPGGRGVPAFSSANKTILQILAVMEELDRPVLASELWEILEERKNLEAIKYHLSVLVKAGVVELIIGPELSFALRKDKA